MFSMAKVELQLVSDIDMHLFFEEDMKCNVCFISKRYSKAKNK